MKKIIKQTVKDLINLHNTKNIYKLYKYYGINIIYGNLVIKGCFFIDGNTYFVAIKKTLSARQKETTFYFPPELSITLLNQINTGNRWKKKQFFL